MFYNKPEVENQSNIVLNIKSIKLKQINTR